MGSRPRIWNGNANPKVIITTPEGAKGIGAECAIIYVGYLHSDLVMKYVQEHPHYVAKHCDDLNEITHITESGVVNRYGFLFTKTKLDFSKEIDVERRWFTAKEVPTYEALIEYVEEFLR